MSEVRLEPTAEEIERVANAIYQGAWADGYLSEADYVQEHYRDMARAAILAMDRRASPPAPAVAVPDGWRALVREAIDLLAERTYGSPARSPGHNARLKLEAALAAAPQPPATQNYEEKRDDGLEAGTLSEIMSAAWPEYGGNHQEPEFWRDFGEGVQFALKHLTAIRSLKGPRDE